MDSLIFPINAEYINEVNAGGSLRHPPGPPDSGAGERAVGSLRRTLPAGLSPGHKESLGRFDNSIHPEHGGCGKRDTDCRCTPRQHRRHHRISQHLYLICHRCILSVEAGKGLQPLPNPCYRTMLLTLR